MDLATPARAIPLPIETKTDRSERTSARARVGVTSWPLLAILSVFWIYVMVSNVLYAWSMAIHFDPDGSRDLFAPWDVRVLQHLLLFPLLVGAISVSLRVGWRPVWRALPVQILQGVAFSACGSPLLNVSEAVVNCCGPHSHSLGTSVVHALASVDPPVWVASATSFLLSYGFALALVTGFALYRRFRDSELRLEALERAWNGARLAALRMQLSPHTLFNLLHTIRGQIAWNPAAAQSMVVQLGDLLRRLLTVGERDFSRLSDELDFARLYLELQQRRFADRLSLALPDTSVLPDTWVPSLILQPLIENAVTHGLANHAGPVAVRVDVSASNGTLRLRVVNSTARERDRRPDGVGLRNVRERLAVHFGARARLETGPSGAEEWTAQICMPLLSEGGQSRVDGPER